MILGFSRDDSSAYAESPVCRDATEDGERDGQSQEGTSWGARAGTASQTPACTVGHDQRSPSEQTFLLMNIQRLITVTGGRSKSAFLIDQAQFNNAMCVGITETWLCDNVLDEEVTHSFPGYSMSRSDRHGKQGGGVALFVRDDLTSDVLLI